MELTFDWFDGRMSNDRNVINTTSGEVVGFIKSGDRAGIEISLFDRKYEARVSCIEECQGFVKGVQCVLNRMVSPDDDRRRLENKLHKLQLEHRDPPFGLSFLGPKE